jgi:lipopolysaccharide export system protein LptA
LSFLRFPGAAVAGALLVLVSAHAADIWARKMEIIKTRFGQETVFSDSVSITDGDTRITAGRARMNEQSGYAVIADSVVIENPDARVLADSAVYGMEQRITRLFGDVVVEQESVLIRAPFLLYSIADKKAFADSGVEVRSRTRDMWLSGDRGTYDMAENVGRVDSNPVLVQVSGDDTVTVTGLEVSWLEAESRAVALGEVKVSSGKAVLECDTLHFFPGADSGLAFGNPRVADSLSRTDGDTIVLKVAGGNLEQVVVSGHAAGKYQTESGDVVDVVGRVIRIDMEEGDVERIEVIDMESGRLARARNREQERS